MIDATSTSLPPAPDADELPRWSVLRERRAGMMAVPTLAGELDAAVADRVHAVLHGSLERGPAGLIVDFSQVTFCDSATISVLIRLAKKARDTGRYFAVVATHRAVIRPITILGMQTLFNVHSTVNGALAAGAGSDGHEPAR